MLSRLSPARLRQRVGSKLAEGFFRGLSTVGRLHPLSKLDRHGVEALCNFAYCDDDRGCADWSGTTCEPKSRKCIQLDLCKADADCPAGQECVEQAGACVAVPAEQGVLPAGGQPALDCYFGEPQSPPDDPPTCLLQGRVVNYNGQPLQETIGLVVRIHLRDDVLLGILDSPLDTTEAFDDSGLGQYELTGVPTNTHLVLEVQGRTEDAPASWFASMFTFGIFLRADDCTVAGGTISLAAPAIFQANYEAYSNALGVAADADKGLLFGRLRDCDGERIVHGTGGLSMEHELLYYLSSSIPAPDATGTDSSGFFVAANVSPIRGVASALVLSDAVSVSLWHKPVRVFMGAASLVLFEQPQAPRQ